MRKMWSLIGKRILKGNDWVRLQPWKISQSCAIIESKSLSSNEKTGYLSKEFSNSLTQGQLEQPNLPHEIASVCISICICICRIELQTWNKSWICTSTMGLLFSFWKPVFITEWWSHKRPKKNSLNMESHYRDCLYTLSSDFCGSIHILVKAAYWQYGSWDARPSVNLKGTYSGGKVSDNFQSELQFWCIKFTCTNHK